jgi:hypothetical protein
MLALNEGVHNGVEIDLMDVIDFYNKNKNLLK